MYFLIRLVRQAEACPVVYLLHGYGGNARSWIGS